MFSRSQWIWVFIALAALRLVIGYHFFTEGKSKIDSGSWDASGFFKTSVGPFRPMYLKMLPDYEGTETLCIYPAKSENQKSDEEKDSDQKAKKESEILTRIRPIKGSQFVLDTRPTIACWSQFQKKVMLHYGLSKAELESRRNTAKRRVDSLKEEINSLQKSGDVTSVAASRKLLLEMQNYHRRLTSADPYNETFLVLGRRSKQLHDYLSANLEEIENFAIGKSRLEGFAIDKEGRKKAGVQVESLRGQIKSIDRDRGKIRSQHVTEIQGIWEGLEAELNQIGQSIAVSPADRGSGSDRPSPELFAPSEAGPSTMVFWVNRIVPYFDLVIGILLLLGLFSRLASVAGVFFLLGILGTQLPWVPGAANTFPQWIECIGLLVIAATGAGRFGGIDGLIWWMFRSKDSREATSQSTEPATAS